MKKTLTACEITDNLKRLFAGKDIKCTEVISGGKWDSDFFYIETKFTKVVIINKTIWVKPSVRQWYEYLVYCKDFGIMYQKQRTAKLGTVIPFIYLPPKSSKEAREQADLLLQACGLKSPKKKDEDIARLREFGVKHYIEFYKLIKDIEVISSNLEYEKVYSGYGKYEDGKLLLSVTHKTGSFKFPIENITGYSDQDEQIQNIFFNLLGKPVTSKVNELVAA